MADPGEGGEQDGASPRLVGLSCMREGYVGDDVPMVNEPWPKL